MTGTFAFPAFAAGFDAGVKYVNEELGGVNGNPLKSTLCASDGTPDGAVNCGNQFVQSNVVLSVLGFDYGADGILPVLKAAGVAEFGYQAITPGMNNAVGQAFFASPSTQEAYSAAVVAQQGLGVKSLATVLPDLPPMHEYFETVVAPAAQRLGVGIRAFYYPATGPDWASFASSVVATQPDGVTLYVGDADALAAVPAFRGTGFTGVLDASTSTSIIPKLSAQNLEKVIFVNPFFNNLYADSALSPKVKADLAAFERHITPDPATYTFAQAGFFDAVQAADMLRQVADRTGAPLTRESVLRNIGNTKGSTFFRDGTYDCSTPSWPGTTSCTSGFNYAQVGAGKKLTPLPNSPVNVSAVKPVG
ncbi:hypothetical protein GCM10009836_16980 [Pseudonocardia ailaonensis]|uniref:Leucine-binding protein domain-containing protein n=1 Tax=Pseudonocardia ailaonensis TaxID=367279 RepID=A0ABN2MTU9_9PSEU